MGPKKRKVKKEESEEGTWVNGIDGPPTRKKRRVEADESSPDTLQVSPVNASFEPLLSLASLYEPEADSDEEPGYDETFEALSSDLLRARSRLLAASTTTDVHGRPIRPLTRAEADALRMQIESEPNPLSPSETILLRKLKPYNTKPPSKSLSSQPQFLYPPPPLPASPPPPHAEVISTLYSLKVTPFANSFASRLTGRGFNDEQTRFILRDWETRSPWMELMQGIRDHYALAYPDREHASETIAPIDYVTLQPKHLPQIHDLLTRAFWPGIDVSDSLQYSPEQCTIVALYKHMVIGAAFMSASNEAYITYIVVRPGWEDSHIATFMLYHLITSNPNHDVTLHVSANNPAMLLYNRFGFKAEEFIVGFYEEYLDSKSRACKNALRLRLRR